jgi:hypothetical protein
MAAKNRSASRSRSAGDRGRAESAQTVELVGVACRGRHLMAALDELPHERRADRARGTRNEYPHDASCR